MTALLIVALLAAVVIALVAWDIRKVTLNPDEPHGFR